MKAAKLQLLLFVAVCGLLSAPVSLLAQDKDKEKDKGEKVLFVTADGVKIRGTYYASAKKKMPVVILLHALGEDSRRKSWQNLAETLQKGGLNVLSFDFRGHGESQELDDADKFWNEQQPNGFFPNVMAGGKNGFKKRTIEFKNFSVAYYPYLLNDISAARCYLELNKNDGQGCSTSSIILIGAETGATLGAGWMYSEWFRFKFTPPAMAGMPPEIDKRAEGRDIIGGIWLSLSPQLAAKRPVKIETIIGYPGSKGTSMLFIHGDGDAAGKKLAKANEKFLNKTEKNRFTLAYELKGTKLTGAELLQPTLETDKRIMEYLDELIEKNANLWSEREFKKSFYCRTQPGDPNNPIAIKVAGDNNLLFEAYDKFLP